MDLTILRDVGLTETEAKIYLMLLEEGNSLAGKIISSHLDYLGRRDFRSIARALKAKPEDVKSAAEIIMALEPRPGRQFSDELSRYIEPDVYVFKIKDKFAISLNNSGLPRLSISSFFRKALNNGNAIPGEASNYLRDKLRSAQWLIRSIQQRQRTIFNAGINRFVPWAVGWT